LTVPYGGGRLKIMIGKGFFGELFSFIISVVGLLWFILGIIIGVM
jgi:hypothetical protein